jgi:2-oxoglutarate dehydrogenase E1 component
LSTQVQTTERHENESFLTGTSSVYAEHMYERYEQDPASVPESWRRYFDGVSQGTPYDAAAYSKPTAVLSPRAAISEVAAAPSDSLGVAHLIRAYQVNGHTAAKLDPLDTYAPEAFPYRPGTDTDLSHTTAEGGWYPPELTPEYHGFAAADLDRVMNFRGTSAGGNKGYLEDLAGSPHKVTLRRVLDELRKTYTGTVGVEYMVRAHTRTRAKATTAVVAGWWRILE